MYVLYIIMRIMLCGYTLEKPCRKQVLRISTFIIKNLFRQIKIDKIGFIIMRGFIGNLTLLIFTIFENGWQTEDGHCILLGWPNNELQISNLSYPLNYNYCSFCCIFSLPVASPGFFRGGGTPRPHKCYHAPPSSGGPGAATPQYHFLKRCKVLEVNPFFKNINILLAKESIFSKKNFENRAYCTRISECFRKII